LARLALDSVAPVDFTPAYWQGVDVTAADAYFASMPTWQRTTFGNLQAGCRGNTVEIVSHPLWSAEHLHPQAVAAQNAATSAGYQNIVWKSLFEVLRRPY
jgi:hypothetical protein